MKKLIAIALTTIFAFLFAPANLATAAPHATPANAAAAKLFTAKAEVENMNADEGIYIISGSDINLVARSSNIPVQIQNNFEQDVTVHVHVRPTNLRVIIPSSVAIKVPAQSSATAKVPVEAVANGEVFLKVWIETFSGNRIGTPVIFDMNVNADVESALLISFGGGIIVLLGFGITRTVLKNRRRGNAEFNDGKYEEATA